MISRLTALAATLAVVATASLAFAANSALPGASGTAAAKPVRIVELERVVIVAKRAAKAD